MRIGFRRAWAAAAAIGAAAVLGAGAASGAAPPPALAPVSLPRDHGAHAGFQVEWWYTAGTIAAAGHGDGYFWFATAWASPIAVVARVNVVDLRSDRVVLSQEYTKFGALAAGETTIGVGAFGLAFHPGGALGSWSVDAPVGAHGRLRLDLAPAQPYMLNGARGIVPQGKGAASAYYSAPRVAAKGTLETGGHTVAVAGQGWFDHQWGNFAANASSMHWNWFACQFADRSDLMLYQFISPAGRPIGVQSASFMAPGGAVSHPTSFTITPRPPAIRPGGATGTYPLGWRLTVPSAHVDVTLAARARNQFIANRFVPGFWEGAAAITRGNPGACIVESTRESG